MVVVLGLVSGVLVLYRRKLCYLNTFLQSANTVSFKICFFFQKILSGML